MGRARPESLAKYVIELLFRIRSATALDSRLLWEWVNDPKVRASAFVSDAIGWDDHQKWFALKCAQRNAGRIFHRGEDADGVPIGQFRADLQADDDGRIDVSVSREARGSGYASLLIELGARRVFDETEVKRLTALVKVGNVSSRESVRRRQL